MSGHDEVREIIAGALAADDGPVLFLTGAGISAESGIPTFRGPEGYWRVGSRNYHPQELATFASFREMPAEVWSWYLYRRAVCRAAEPNAGHRALVALEQTLDGAGEGERFRLVTQNVDGLHQRAGSRRTWAIHGNIDEMRPVAERHGTPARRAPIPARFDDWRKGQRLTPAELDTLRVEGKAARPHVLWFDESYDEPNFHFESARRAAQRASMLVVVGTSGATNLPMQIALLVARRGRPAIVIDPAPNPFSEITTQTGHGAFLRGTAGEHVPWVCDEIATALLPADRRER